MADANPSTPWDTTYDEAWAAEVGKWEWATDEDKVRTEGDCPRCGHRMNREVRRGSVRAALALPDEGAPVPVVVACNCTEPHEGRPTSQTGCGKQATFRLPL